MAYPVNTEMSIANTLNLELNQLDIETAYLHSVIEEVIHLQISKGFEEEYPPQEYMYVPPYEKSLWTETVW